MNDPNHLPGLFGGTLTVERIQHFARAFKSITPNPVMPTPVVLPAWLFDKAEAQGCEMDGYVRQERIIAE